jgi:arginase family enzyme
MIIAKIPTSLGSMSKNKGCEKAPDEIIKELRNIEVNESLKEIKYEVSEVRVSSNLDETNRNIEKAEGNIFIGGDHSITYSLFKSLKSKNKGLIIFDAHVDLDNYTDTPTHEDFLRKLIDENHLNPNNLVIIGVRKIWKNELRYAKEKNIRLITTKHLHENSIEDICDGLMENSRNFEELYISIDIDVLDPSTAPGTHYTEPNGLTLAHLLYFLRRLKLLKNIKKIDLVEVNPEIENNLTTKTAAKIIAELI